MEILRFDNLTYAHAGAERPVLDGVSFALEKGDFALLYGQNGSGKSTLLRLCKPELTMTGRRTGKIFAFGKELPPFGAPNVGKDAHSPFRIGFVGQNPRMQIVTDRVWHELSFGPESMGMEGNEMRRRVAEIACFFGLERRFLDETATLSGGQAQLLNLAAAMATDPELLLLDEPTAQLDPIAASNFLSMLGRIHREMGVTVLLCEHRTEEILPMANRLLVLSQGKILSQTTPTDGIRALSREPRLARGMPAPIRLSAALGSDPVRNGIPLTLGQGRAMLSERVAKTPPHPLPEPEEAGGEEALSMQQIRFRYEKDGEQILSDLSLSVRFGEILCLLGGNGSGKTTALSCAAGLLRPQSGQLRIGGKRHKYDDPYPEHLRPVMLVQDVTTCFSHATAEDELKSVGCDPKALPWTLDFPLSRHPYDLSGGEQQLLALSMLLALEPKILLLDEPTKGLDRFSADKVALALRALRDRGCALILVTHECEFAAQMADRVALLFRGEIVSEAPTREFFRTGRFYTTPACLLTRGILDAVTVEVAARALGAEVEA